MKPVHSADDSASHPLAGLIDALGAERFEVDALDGLAAVCGAESWALYRVGRVRAEMICGASAQRLQREWARHAAPRRQWLAFNELQIVQAAAGGASLLRARPDDVPDGPLRATMERLNIVDHLLVLGRRGRQTVAISLLRSRDTGPFGPGELNRLADNAGLLVGICAKQIALQSNHLNRAEGFNSVAFIEDRLRRSDWGLSRRELHVGARLLFGISVLGAAVDLGLSEVTIATYRKRLYRRLQISGRHEFFQKYLRLLSMQQLSKIDHERQTTPQHAYEAREEHLLVA